MAFTAKGRLHDVFDTQQVSASFSKREFILEIQEGQYPEQIKFQLTNLKVDLIDPYQIGQEIEVTFNLRGRGNVKDGKTTYFTNLEAWKVQPLGGSPTQLAPAAQPQRQNNNPALRAQPAAPIASDEDNDLPF